MGVWWSSRRPLLVEPERIRTWTKEQRVMVAEISSVEVCPVKGVAGQIVHFGSWETDVSVMDLRLNQ